EARPLPIAWRGTRVAEGYERSGLARFQKGFYRLRDRSAGIRAAQPLTAEVRACAQPGCAHAGLLRHLPVRVPGDLPEVAVRVLEVTGVATPEGVLSRL